MFFKNLDYFYLLLLLLFVIVFAIYRFTNRKKQIQKWLGQQSSFLRVSISDKKRIAKTVVSFIVLFFLILSLARLQGPGEKKEMSRKGSSILLMLDVSQSMLVEDVKPNRLLFMKQELSRFIDLSWGDQIALGFFAKSAFLVSPFTSDLSAIKSYLNDLSPEYISNQGTDFQRVFELADDVFSRQKNLDVKVILIASDGENHSRKTQDLIKTLLNQEKLRVFTLSVGTQKGGVIPLRDYQDQIKEYKKDSRGELVISRLNTKSLQSFSKWGKGAYYHVSYGNLAIEKLREDLNVLKKNFFENQTQVQKKEYYQWFLIMALFLALFELILSSRNYGVKK